MAFFPISIMVPSKIFQYGTIELYSSYLKGIGGVIGTNYGIVSEIDATNSLKWRSYLMILNIGGIIGVQKGKNLSSLKAIYTYVENFQEFLVHDCRIIRGKNNATEHISMVSMFSFPENIF